jgi:hypothetical protein
MVHPERTDIWPGRFFLVFAASSLMSHQWSVGRIPAGGLSKRFQLNFAPLYHENPHAKLEFPAHPRHANVVTVLAGLVV